MLAVASGAPWRAHLVERGFMNTLREHVFEERVTSATHRHHGFELRGGGAMIAVAGGAAWRRKVPALGQGLPMDAPAVFSKLRRAHRPSLHALRVGVALSAGLGKTEWMHGGQRVPHLADAVRVVAVRARRHRHVTLSQPLSMDARAVLRKLIHSLLGLKAVYQSRIAMASRTKFGNAPARDDATESPRRAHRNLRVHARRVSAMASGAAEPAMSVDVIFE